MSLFLCTANEIPFPMPPLKKNLVVCHQLKLARIYTHTKKTAKKLTIGLKKIEMELSKSFNIVNKY